MSEQMPEAEKKEKARLADLKMAEMRLKNEMLMKRHEEIEADKRNANMMSKMAGLKINEGEPGGEQKGIAQSTKSKPNPIGRDRGATGGGRHSQDSNKPPSANVSKNPPQQTGGGRSPGGGPTKAPPPPDPKNFLDDPGRKGEYQNFQRFPPDSSNFGNGPVRGAGRGRGKSSSFDAENPPRGGYGRGAGGSSEGRGASGGGGVLTKKDMELHMTGSERLDYKKWLDERARIDADRLARQQTTSGEWRREWDAEKSAKSHENELPISQNNRRNGPPQNWRQNQGFDQFRQSGGGNRNQQNDGNRGYGDNGQASREFNNSRHPRRFSDSDDHGGNRNDASHRNAARGNISTESSGNGFGVVPVAADPNLAPKPPRGFADSTGDVEIVKFSVKNNNADANRNRQNYDEHHQRGFQSQRSGGGFSDTGSSGRRNNHRSSPGNAHVSSGGNRDGQKWEPAFGSSHNGGGSFEKNSKFAQHNNAWSPINQDQAAAAPEENWDAELMVVGAATSVTEKSRPLGGAKIVEEESVEADDDQWEDVDEDGDVGGGFATETPSSALPRRRAVSEEIRQANQPAADFDDDDEYVEPAEYGAFEKQRSDSTVEFHDVQSDRETSSDNVHDDVDEMLNVARQRNESMDQIERDMIDRLNENIEAVEAALGKHDEEYDAILYGARLDSDRNVEGYDDDDDSPDLSPLIGNVSNPPILAAAVDPDVKVCVDSMVFTVST